MIKKKAIFGGDSMFVAKLPAYFFFAALLWVAWNLYAVVSPFIMVLIFSAIIATVTFPVYSWFEVKLKGKKSLAAVITCLLVMFAVIIPILLFLAALTYQLIDLVKAGTAFLYNVDFNSLMSWRHGNFFYDLSGPYSADVSSLVQQNFDSFRGGLTQVLQTISTFAAKQSAQFLADVGVFIFNLFLMLFTLYYFYKDGRFLLRKLMILSPIPQKYEKEIFVKFDQISRATLFGTFLTSVTQGFVAWVGYMIAGVPNAFFWATATTAFSLIPAFGTSIVWFPMGLFLLISGNWWGLFILAWGLFLVSTVDNLLRVVFIGNSAKLNPLLTFISVFGGLIVFGLIGVILGPMLLVLFMTLLHVYELEYDGMLGEEQDLGLNEPLSGKKRSKIK